MSLNPLDWTSVQSGCCLPFTDRAKRVRHSSPRQTLPGPHVCARLQSGAGGKLRLQWGICPLTHTSLPRTHRVPGKGLDVVQSCSVSGVTGQGS